MYDVIIIGAGVTGCAIARELSRYERSVLVLEKGADVCEGTSKANSGIVHSGYDAKPGSMKARMNLRGNELMPQLAKDLDFPYKQNGSLVLAFDEADRHELNKLLERGQKNNVKGLRIVERAELKEMEPAVSEHAIMALYAPTGGIVCPFGITIALAENAADNGASFKFQTKVQKIEKRSATDSYLVTTDMGVEEGKIIINAAGVYADAFHNMVSQTKMKIIPRKGEYCLMDKTAGELVSHTLFQLPTQKGKGVLVTPTVHGNLLVGPTAEDIEDKESVETTTAGLADVLQKAALSVEKVPGREIITSFAGLRAHEEGNDFVIKEVEDSPGFIDAAGIESPGLTSAPAIGEYVAVLVQERYPAKLKHHFISVRKGIPSMAHLSEKKKNELIQKDSSYAHIICRCEMVTEGEILSAIHRTLGATTLDGIKRRTRAGMGRCQSGFCSPKTVGILARELGVDESEITKCGGDSTFLVGKDKENV